MPQPQLPSMDDILKEIDRLQSNEITGFTTAELMEKTGKNDNWCREYIKKLMIAGKVEYAGKVKRTTIDGRVCRIPVYRLIKERTV